MGHPRIRDFFTIMTTLPASVLMTACLFLPHTQSCDGHVRVPVECGLGLAIAPIIVLGLLPIAWHVFPRVRESAPELVLAFTILAIAFSVVTIRIGIWVMWGYAKRSFRGELLVAMCSATLVVLWLSLYPLATLFDTWLPAAELTWGAGCAMLAGMALWTSAALARGTAGASGHALVRGSARGLTSLSRSQADADSCRR